MVKDSESWTVSQLHDMLDGYEIELRDADLKENTVRTYVDRSRFFVRWLDG